MIRGCAVPNGLCTMAYVQGGHEVVYKKKIQCLEKAKKLFRLELIKKISKTNLSGFDKLQTVIENVLWKKID